MLSPSLTQPALATKVTGTVEDVKASSLNANFLGAHGVSCACCNWGNLGQAGKSVVPTDWYAYDGVLVGSFVCRGVGGERKRKTLKRERHKDLVEWLSRNKAT